MYEPGYEENAFVHVLTYEVIIVFRGPGRINDIGFFYFAIDVPSSLPLLHFFDHADTLKVVLVLTNTALCVYVIKKW